jgi:hypothetical protein
MKTLSTIIALFVTLSFASCKKDEMLGSDVTLTVHHNTNTPDAGARVYLFQLKDMKYDPDKIIDSHWDKYPGEMDYNYAQFSGTIGNDGKVQFRKVPFGYYMMAVYTKKTASYRVKQITVGPDDKTYSYRY